MEILIMIGVLLSLIAIVMVLYGVLRRKEPQPGRGGEVTDERSLVLKEPKKRNDIKVVRFEEDEKEIFELAHDWEGSTSGYERVYKGGGIAQIVEKIIVDEANKRATMLKGDVKETEGKEDSREREDMDGRFIGYRPKDDVKYVSKGVNVGNALSLRDCLAQLKDVNPAFYDAVFDHFGWKRDERSFNDANERENYHNVYASLKETFKDMVESAVARYVKETFDSFDRLRQIPVAVAGCDSAQAEETAEKPRFLDGF